MAKTQDFSKASSQPTPEFNEMGTPRPFENIDTTADVKDKLARKLGFKGNTLAPFELRPFAQFAELKKKQQKAKLLKQKP